MGWLGEGKHCVDGQRGAMWRRRSDTWCGVTFGFYNVMLPNGEHDTMLIQMHLVSGKWSWAGSETLYFSDIYSDSQLHIYIIHIYNLIYNLKAFSFALNWFVTESLPPSPFHLQSCFALMMTLRMTADIGCNRIEKLLSFRRLQLLVTLFISAPVILMVAGNVQW